MAVLYQPDDRPPVLRVFLYSLQWLAFNLVNVSVVPLVVGTALGLDQRGIAELAQRTMFYASLASILQAMFGHRLPIIEGPAGMWWGIFITLAAMAPALGKDLAVLRTDLEAGVIAAGLVLIVMGLTGLMGRALKLFTPAVTGTVLMLLTLQLSGSFVKGMLGITTDHPAINPTAAMLSLLVVAVVVFVNLRAAGFVRSIAILIGTAVGWLAAVPLGLASDADIAGAPLMQFPALFAWGMPTVDPGILLVCVLTGILVLSNLVASIIAMERTLEVKLQPKAYNRAVAFTGIADVLSGLGATVGVVPYSASAGLVSLTGVASRLPFYLFAAVMMALGLFPPVGMFLSSVPEPVGYSVVMVSFCQMLGFALKDYARLKLTGREYFVIGIPLLVGSGLLSLSPAVFAGVPVILRYVLGNGFVAGMLLCILLEHVIIPKRYFETEDTNCR